MANHVRHWPQWRIFHAQNLLLPNGKKRLTSIFGDAQDQDTVQTCGGPYRGHKRLSLLCVYTQNPVTVSGNRGSKGPNVYNKTYGQRFPRLDLLLWLVGNFSMFVYCIDLRISPIRISVLFLQNVKNILLYLCCLYEIY